MTDNKTICKSIADLMEACWFIREDCEACGDCPIDGICLADTTFEQVADLLGEGSIKDFLKYAYGGEAEAYRYEHMNEHERYWNDMSEIANLERSDIDE